MFIYIIKINIIQAMNKDIKIFMIIGVVIIIFVLINNKQNEYFKMITNPPFEGTNEFHYLPPNNYVRQNRYNSDNGGILKLDEPSQIQIIEDNKYSLPCLDCNDCNWNLEYTAGANNTYGDNIYHYISPRMVLKNNSLKCNAYDKQNSYITPNGTTSKVVQNHDGSLEQGDLLYDDLPVQYPKDNRISYTSTGYIPPNNGCLNKFDL